MKRRFKRHQHSEFSHFSNGRVVTWTVQTGTTGWDIISRPYSLPNSTDELMATCVLQYHCCHGAFSSKSTLVSWTQPVPPCLQHSSELLLYQSPFRAALLDMQGLYTAHFQQHAQYRCFNVHKASWEIVRNYCNADRCRHQPSLLAHSLRTYAQKLSRRTKNSGLHLLRWRLLF